MTGFQAPCRITVTFAGAIERVVGAGRSWSAPDFGHIDEVRHQVLAEVVRIDEMGHAEAFAPGPLAVVVEIDDR